MDTDGMINQLCLRPFMKSIKAGKLQSTVIMELNRYVNSFNLLENCDESRP